MLDVEFVSELTIGMLHGLQNKKEQLDDWYKAYEKEFPNRSVTESAFARCLGELTAILPDCEATRWRKKSDFYSLFLALIQHAGRMPFASNERAQLRAKLIEFGAAVDRILSDPDWTGAAPNVKSYSLAVERAASDLSNRRERHRVINQLIVDCLIPVSQGA